MTLLTSGLAVFIAAATGVFGLLIGSFLNVVIYRVPAGMSLVRPSSACPKCHHEIKGYDNVPLFSWLLLRGKCRNCKTGISARYPLVEVGTAIFFAIVASFLAVSIVNGTTPQVTIAATIQLVAFLYLTAITVALALIDLDTHTLPNAIVLPGYVVGIVLLTAASILNDAYGPLLQAGIGMAAMAALYFILALVRPGGMGLGDVKLAGVLGLFLGWTGWGALIVGAFAAFLLGGFYGIGKILAKRANRKSGIPFGPWMLAGAWIGVFFGNQIWSGYLTLMGLGAN